jgi:hypothetical protein
MERAGLSTVTLSPIPELTASVGAPRVAALEYPLGRCFGRPGDAEGQTEVLRATLDVAVRAEGPGAVVPLPFEWPDPPPRVRSDPPEPPPIVSLLRRRPWLVPRLLRRDPPG